MKIGVPEASGRVLDYLVAVALGWRFYHWHLNDGAWQCWAEKLDDQGRGPAGYFPVDDRMQFSVNPAAGQPVLEAEGVGLRAVRRPGHSMDGLWLAAYDHGNTGSMVQWVKRKDWHKHYFEGPTMLIAGLRCVVAKRLGNEVDVPEELLK